MNKQDDKIKIKTRNWLAVHAHFRKAGPMKDNKKAQSKYECRAWKRNASKENE
jgi:hypothetical protein